MVELIWDGKYDAQGRRVAPLRLKLPFQTVETVNESAELRQRSLFGGARTGDWRNRLIWGDKKYVLPALLDEFAGKVDLIYIDPPFATGADFSYIAQVGDESFTRQPSIIEQKAYRDTWGRGLDGYLQWFYETVVLLHELLSSSGSMYVHCDWHVNSVIQQVLNEIFGRDLFQSEIIWKRKDSNLAGTTLPVVTDTIYFYSKSAKPTWNRPFVGYSDERIEKAYRNRDEDGRQFALSDLMAPGDRKGTKADYEWNGVRPRAGRHWAYTIEKMQELEAQGRIFWNSAGIPKLKNYLDEGKGSPLNNLWSDIAMVKGGLEATSYPTQKPEALLERIIQASSNEGDLILDCFAGSGTTAAVAEKLGRRWITCDLGRFAVHTTRKRLLSIPDVRPFVVQNLGKYERQAWQAAEFGGPERAAEINARYRRFILDLYGARPIEGYSWLHGVKGGRMVHVGPVDSPISPGDVTQIAIEFRKAIGTGADAPSMSAVDVLGWDFAFELNEVARQQAEAANLTVRFVRIPREVLEQKAVDQGDIRFFELAALSIDVRVETFRRNVSTPADPPIETFRRNVSTPTTDDMVETFRRNVSTPTTDDMVETFRRNVSTGGNVTLALTDFVIPPDDVPEDVQRAISHWSQWIDYWAVDWDNQGDTFHNMWQTYRTRGKKKGGDALQLQTTHRYEESGEYTIMVKVIDILGNDTTKTVKVKVS